MFTRVHSHFSEIEAESSECKANPQFRSRCAMELRLLRSLRPLWRFAAFGRRRSTIGTRRSSPSHGLVGSHTSSPSSRNAHKSRSCGLCISDGPAVCCNYLAGAGDRQSARRDPFSGNSKVRRVTGGPGQSFCQFEISLLAHTLLHESASCL